MLRFLLLLSLASLGIAPSASAEQFVVVPAEAKLYPAPNVGGQTITLGEQHTTLKKLGEKGGWVHVEANGPTKGSCVSSAWKLGELTLKMWVPKSKLTTVTRSRVTTAHDDGTRVTVAAGVPLKKVSGQHFAVLGGVRWPLNPEASEIGKSFEPAPLTSAKGTWMLASGDLKIGGRPVGKTAGEGFRVTNEINVDGQTRHRIVRHCLSAIVQGKLAEPESDSVGGILGSLMGGGGGEHWSIASNSKVFWPDGTLAGHFRTSGWLAVDEATPKNGKLCGLFGNDDDIEACFDPKKAKKQKGNDLSSVFGSGGLGIGGLGVSPNEAPTQKGISRAVIRRIMRQKQRALRSCYKKAKIRSGDRVEFKFSVLENGHVSNVSSSSANVTDPAVRECMVNVVRGAMFAAKRGREPVDVSYVVTFEAKR